MSYDPNNQGNPPEDPSNPPNGGGYPAGDPGNPGYPPVGGPGYPPPGNPGYPPAGGPGYPPAGGPGYPPAGGPGYPPAGGPGYPPPGGPGYPPPGGPGYPPPYPGYNPPPLRVMPKSLGEILSLLPRQYWRVLSHPGATTFAEEQVTASWGAIWVQLIGYAIIAAIFTFVFETLSLSSFLKGFFSTYHPSGQTINVQQITSGFQAATVGVAFATLIFTVVGFFIGAGIYWLIAKAFRGQGPFLQYAYCYLLIYVPLGIISYLLLLVPGVGIFVSSALGIYEIVLLIMMTSGVHRMSGGKATLAVLILPIILIILACIGSISLFAIIANAMQHMQSTPSY